jgi:glyoxylase-like metal-dependent hydrolase (beta-lactamase superfamily II)
MLLPLEDSYADVLGKALRGHALTAAELAVRLQVEPSEVETLLDGTWSELLARRAATVLNLRADSLVALAEKTWRPRPPEFFMGLAEFTTPFGDMTVNAYLVWNDQTKQAVMFDTGADASGALRFAQAHDLKIRAIFLTHTHGDHVFDLDRAKELTGAPAYVNAREPFEGAESFDTGRRFAFEGLELETRLTWGHSPGGTTFVIHGLTKPLAVVGDALFAGSMGGAKYSYSEALRTDREEILSLPPETILCPGHGPLTTVAEERAFNPFFPELT